MSDSTPSPVAPRRRWWRHPLAWTAGALALVLVAVGLWAFQPWRLFTSSEVDEALPQAGEPSADDATAEEDAMAEEESAEPAPSPTEPVVLSEGGFVTQEHDTSGTARVFELPDGTRHVRLEDLATSDGPDLYVWLTDQEAGGDWFKYDDGRSIDLGSLKGTHGNANYEIPADADIEGMTSVVIWCDRFSVAFGSAPVEL